MKRICFLFNHDEAHQVSHSLPIALAMARETDAEVTLAVGDDAMKAALGRFAGVSALRIASLRRSCLTTWAGTVLDRIAPARRVLAYRDNLDFFRGFDALVVSEKTSLVLKTRYGLTNLKYIHTRHGAGDRAVGFDAASNAFDLILVSGTKIRDRLIAEANVAPEKIRVVGYVKFELYGENRPVLPFAANGRPTVLYNPHAAPHLSSWFAMGERVLSQFADCSRYNLIFAPHIMLFRRRWSWSIDRLGVSQARPPDPALATRANMLIDLGSERSTDMSYVNNADLYLGDVSSQVYEFLNRPRPCLFLNAHRAHWQDNPDYRNWLAGPVVDSADHIIAQVDRAFALHPLFREIQYRMIAESFSTTNQPASVRAAQAIASFLELPA